MMSLPMSRFPRRSARAQLPKAAAVILVAALGGCGKSDRIVASSIPLDDYHQRHPIVLAQASTSIDVFPITGSGRMDKLTAKQVIAFAGQYRDLGHGPILVLLPSGSHGASGQGLVADIKRALAVGGARGGVEVSTYPVTDPGLAAPVRLSFVGVKAKVADQCGQWPKDLNSGSSIDGWDNKPYWNLGCAHQQMLAAQASDPRDLVTPRGEETTDTLIRMRGIESIRKGTDPNTNWTVKKQFHRFRGEQLMLASFDGDNELIAHVPRISIQAFCETPELAQIVQAAGADRRMEKAHVKFHMGGAVAAVEAFRSAPTPNVIVLESVAERAELLLALESLSDFCDEGTKVVVVGRLNDIVLYRELMARGVSDYLVAPFAVLDFIKAISRLYSAADAAPLGKIIAVTGVKGGVGASVVAHNIAFSIARDLHLQTAIIDMDLAFGTVGLDFNQDPPQGVAEAVFAPDRLDANLVDRLLSRCTDRLSILAAPATLDRLYDFSEPTFDVLIDILRASTPCTVLDVPHVWTAWARRALVGADEIILVAAPDLANLRNAKSMIDTLRAARAHDSAPRLVLNQIGMPKRPEISLADFYKAVDLKAEATIAFEPKLFGTAANNGQMIVEVEAGHKIAETFAELARGVTGKLEIRRPSRNILKPFMTKLSRKKAS